MSSIRILRSQDELDRLEPEWASLLERSLAPNVFLSHLWMSTWARTYLKPGQLFVLALFEENQLVALAPLWIHTAPWGAQAGRRELRFLGSGDVCSDHLDWIVQSHNREAWIDALWRHLTGELASYWDLFDYAYVRSDSRVLSQLHRRAQQDGGVLRLELKEIEVCPFCRLVPDVEALVASWSSSRRYTVGYSQKQLAREGELVFEWADHDGAVAEVLARLKEVNTRTWRAKGERGSFSTDAFERFHLDFARAALKRGWLALLSLSAGTRHLGTFYGFKYGGTLYFYIMSVEPSDQKRVNTGDVLLSHCMQWAARAGCEEFDFLRGGEAYKYRWTDEEHRLISLRIYRRSLRALAVLWMEQGTALLRATGKLLLGSRQRAQAAPAADAS